MKEKLSFKGEGVKLWESMPDDPAHILSRLKCQMIFREVSMYDVEAIAALHAESWQRHYREPTLIRSWMGMCLPTASPSGRRD